MRSVFCKICAILDNFVLYLFDCSEDKQMGYRELDLRYVYRKEPVLFSLLLGKKYFRDDNAGILTREFNTASNAANIVIKRFLTIFLVFVFYKSEKS